MWVLPLALKAVCVRQTAAASQSPQADLRIWSPEGRNEGLATSNRFQEAGSDPKEELSAQSRWHRGLALKLTSSEART